MKVIYQESTKTLRQMPENYLLAQKSTPKGCVDNWRCDPDMAADNRVAIQTFKTVCLIYRHKYEARGEYLADLINKSLDLN